MTAMKKFDYNDRDPLTARIIAICYKIHNELGPGFSERIYFNAFKKLLSKENLAYEEEKKFEVLFDGEKVGKFRVDFIVEDKVIVELKAVSGVIPKIFETQVLSYLKASNLTVGLSINFGNRRCRIRRLMVSSASVGLDQA